MHYQTRHMEALVQMPHGDRTLYPGDTFFVTPIDREYYLKHKRAKDVEETAAAAPEPAPAPAPTPAPAATAPAPAPSSRRRAAAAPAPAAGDASA